MLRRTRIGSANSDGAQHQQRRVQCHVHLHPHVTVTGTAMTKSTIVCFGELLLRLGAPGRERLLQSPRLDVHVGGAEANVAVALAHFGQRVLLTSVVPDNALAAAAVGEMRRHGVDTTHVATAPGRMGLYFL